MLKSVLAFKCLSLLMNYISLAFLVVPSIQQIETGRVVKVQVRSRMNYTCNKKG